MYLKCDLVQNKEKEGKGKAAKSKCCTQTSKNQPKQTHHHGHSQILNVWLWMCMVYSRNLLTQNKAKGKELPSNVACKHCKKKRANTSFPRSPRLWTCGYICMYSTRPDPKQSKRERLTAASSDVGCDHISSPFCALLYLCFV